MSAPRPLEEVVLASAEDAVVAAMDGLRARGHDARLELLEAVACDVAGFALEDYRALGSVSETLGADALRVAARPIIDAIRELPIPTPLALAALSRELITHAERRRAGSYYTDFRLAQFLARRALELRPLERGDLVIDPASGTGILLVAVALAAFGDDRKALNDFVRLSACAGDLSRSALRGARLALTTIASDLDAVRALDKRLRAADSLVSAAPAWRDVAPNGFGLVIGNPPWEKLKISRHEHLAASGALRHYGDDYEAHQAHDEIYDARNELASYVRSFEYELQGKGEPDLYKLFLALSSALVSHRGQIAMLVPAGLIRSDGTRSLREYLLSAASELSIVILENRARFFAIDTRFKFLALTALIDPSGKATPMVIEHATGGDREVEVTGTAKVNRAELVSIRPDYSVPEVRSDSEWELFCRLSKKGTILGDPRGPWRPHFAREVDMTNDREFFARARSNGAVPLVEGRMVHQFRHTAKAYVAGTGRRAEWVWQVPGEAELRPQFWIDLHELPDPVRERTQRPRLGFCDITGQTNERSMLAASIPTGVACGNKVPTILFKGPAHDEEVMAGVWLAVANSFAFDWLLRRVVTTTVNYFLLLSLPFPRLDLDGPVARCLADLTHEVERRYEALPDPDARSLASLRAEIDALVMESYGITPNEAQLILRDFPLLDRGQPALPEEVRSTVTRDLVLFHLNERYEADDLRLADRVDGALAGGAVAYVPSQLAQRTRIAVL